MATALKNLSDYQSCGFGDLSQTRIGIIVSEWNETITSALLDGAINTLFDEGVSVGNIIIKTVPGSFELPLGAQRMLQTPVDAVICLGCVIQGETRHFDFICDAVANGITNVSLEYKKPVIFGVLTTNDMQQAIDRSGGKHGNKGVEAAVSALKMLR